MDADGGDVTGLASNSDGVLYGALKLESGVGGDCDLVTIDTATGEVTTMGESVGGLSCIAFGPAELQADFSADPREGEAPLEVEFTDESSGVVTDWEWDFGDGGTSDDQNPSYTYDSEGTYTVSLTVSGPGGTDTETKSRYIRVAEEEGAVEPASFAHSSLSISPAEAYPNHPILIATSISNSGDTSGGYRVTLNINGTVEQSKRITVSPHSSRRVSFTVYKSVPGTYNVSVSGAHGQFQILSTGDGVAPTVYIPPTVEAEATGGLGTAGIITIVVIAILLIVGIVVAIRWT
jgi:PKD repeat protein